MTDIVLSLGFGAKDLSQELNKIHLFQAYVPFL